MIYVKNMKNETYVYFRIVNFKEDPRDIQIGIHPTGTWKKGEKKSLKNNTGITILTNTWELKSNVSRQKPILSHITYILNLLEQNKSQVKQVTQKYKSIIFCAIYYYETNPSMILNTDILKKLSDFNISLEFDLYCIPRNLI